MTTETKHTARGYTAAHFVMELDGTTIPQLIRSIEGGGVKCDVLTYRSGDSHEQHRQLSVPKYEDLKLQISPSMSKPFYEWIDGFFKGKPIRRTGAISAADFHYKERARREFGGAMLSSFDFPSLDSTASDSCAITVTIKPETVRFKPGSGKELKLVTGGGATRRWLASNFSFEIDGGLKDACKRVTKVDGFSIKQNKIMEYRSGRHIDPINVPGYVEFPNITFHIPEANAQPFVDHFHDHIIKGKPQSSPRLTGRIGLIDHGATTLCGIKLTGIDIFSITPSKLDAQGDEFKMVKVEISVESMKFVYESIATD